ncbi:MAG: hypothetical protein GTO18_08640 [Anaerolineales bacterium]|nr:hypothetical protein [Anaerolineales bacterium]
MQEYEPIDLRPWCNVGPEWVSHVQNVPVPDWPPSAGEFPVGDVEFHGLPFRIGQEGTKTPFVGFGESGIKNAMRVPLDRNARWIIFAHRLLETRLLEGEPVGTEIARYHFYFENDEKITVPVRERFEISAVPMHWGQSPFLAVPDISDRLLSRYEGRWDQIGFRLMDVEMVWPYWFVLWAWKNPYPDTMLLSLGVEPSDRPFLIAAITASSLEEDPFGRGPRLPVIIAMNEQEGHSEGFDISVLVDRGVATYPYPLPAESKTQFLDDPLKGWGQPYNNRNDHAYVEIDARHSATVKVKKGEEEKLNVRWREVLSNGFAENHEARISVVNGEKNWVHVQVLDDETEEPIPCRIHFRTAEGIPYQPHGHHNHLMSDKITWNIDIGGDLRLGHVTYAYIDGKCQGWLPVGEVLVDIARGYEYEPLRTTVNIDQGQRELRLRIKRWADMAEQRWFSGDTHVHFLSTMGALLEGSCEDLGVVNLLQSQWGHYFSNTEDFLGQPISVPGRDTIVYTSQENRQHILGHLILLGLKEPVMPWCTGGSDEAELSGTLETTLCHWADECHDQSGTVIIPHFPVPNCEAAALIATNRADALEMSLHDMYYHLEYYRYLNGGYKLPLVGGTDKMTAEVPVGLNRTYVHIPEEEPFNYENWTKYLRLGRTFVTTGPMLRFTVDGAQVGDTITLPKSGGTVEVEAEARSIFPIHSLEIVQEGRVVASSEDQEGTNRLSLKSALTINRNTWLTARVGGPGYEDPIRHHDMNRMGIMAHSSPIYIAVGDEWWMSNEQTAQYMLTLLHGGLEHIRNRSRQHLAGSVTHHHPEDDHVAFLERPFKEAIQVIQNRKVR